MLSNSKNTTGINKNLPSPLKKYQSHLFNQPCYKLRRKSLNDVVKSCISFLSVCQKVSDEENGWPQYIKFNDTEQKVFLFDDIFFACEPTESTKYCIATPFKIQ